MSPDLARLPEPDADLRRFCAVLARRPVDRVPLVELAVHPRIVDQLLDAQPSASPAENTRRTVRLLHRLGYDVVKISAAIPFQLQRVKAAADAADPRARQWANEHQGPIATLADVQAYPWPRIETVDFGPLETATDALPAGMGLIGFTGGVLEFAMDLVGMQPFLVAIRRNPDLVAAVIEHIGRTLLPIFETYCQMEAVCAVWLGDDLGHKHGLLVSPDFVRRQLVPWYRRFADVAHRAGKSFLLHTCGNTASVMPDLVNEVGIDAKHSFEDTIEPVEQFHDRWADKIAVLGGVDVHLLSSATPAEVRRRTLEILEHVAPRGGYACGSGNSITDYVPPENYLAMVQAVADFNDGK